jgi:hypothetical protein
MTMTRVIRPRALTQGLWLFFLVTGISATAAASAGKGSTGMGEHASISVSRTAVLFRCAAILGSANQTEVSAPIPHFHRYAPIPAEPSVRTEERAVASSLGAAKQAHYGGLSARKE